MIDPGRHWFFSGIVVTVALGYVFGFLCFFHCGCTHQNRSIVAGIARTVLSSASVCGAINRARPALLNTARTRLLSEAASSGWSQQRTEDEMYLLHHADDVLRGLVGSEDIEWSECRVATKEYEASISDVGDNVAVHGIALANSLMYLMRCQMHCLFTALTALPITLAQQTLARGQ